MCGCVCVSYLVHKKLEKNRKSVAAAAIVIPLQNEMQSAFLEVQRPIFWRL